MGIQIHISIDEQYPQDALASLRLLAGALSGQAAIATDLKTGEIIRPGTPGAEPALLQPHGDHLRPTYAADPEPIRAIPAEPETPTQAFTAADAAAALGHAVAETTKKRGRGRPSNAEKAQQMVAHAEAARAEPVAETVSEPEVSGASLDALLSGDVADAEIVAEPEAVTTADAAPETPVADDVSLDALLGTAEPEKPAEVDEMAALLGEAHPEAPKEDYASWAKDKLFEEIRGRASDKNNPRGLGWLREVLGFAKKPTLAALTEDDMRAALIRNDAGLDGA